MGFVEAILEASSLVQEVKEKAATEAWNEGRAEGITEGRGEGRLEEARRLLRSALQARHPGLDTMPEIDAIGTVEELEALLIGEVLSGNDRARVREAILASAR